MLKGALYLAVVGALALTGCVSYEPKPLDRDPSLVPSLSALAPAQHGALTIAELDRLVLANNPDLRAARAKLGIGEAQIIEAGLLPNPQLAFSYPFFVAGADGSDAFSSGISQDLRSILLRPSKAAAAANAASEINASLLWQEWQTIGKARILFVDIVSGDRAEKVIERTRKLLKNRFDRSKAAVDQGSAALATLSPDLAAISDIQKLYDDLERLQFSRRHQLNAMLGLAPDAPLALSGGGEPPALDVPRIRRDLADVADRRPDLIALQYGYRSQEAKLRQAILAQFPNVAIGITGGRDNSGIYSVGPQISFELPVFNRNEGAIATESATREALGREFNARLTAAVGEVEALLSEQALLRKQLASIRPRFKEARDIATLSEKAYKQSLLDERAYVDTQVAQLTIERQQIELQQSMLEGQITLATLTGAGLPQVTITPETPTPDVLGLFQGASR
jgi:outer membrane protein TolC